MKSKKSGTSRPKVPVCNTAAPGDGPAKFPNSTIEYGPITLVNEVGTQRYGVLEGCDGYAVIVRWRDRLHAFERDAGACIETPHGEMAGFRVAEWNIEKIQ